MTRLASLLAPLAALALAGCSSMSAAGPEPPGNASKMFYVSSATGNDRWPGTKAKPWKTLARVSKTTFRPGNRILLRRGDVWSGEKLVLRGSGDLATHRWIGLGAYGEGPKPRLTAPPFDRTVDVGESWSAINAAYPGTNRRYMRIAVRVEGNGWRLRGLEIDRAEVGIYIPSGARYRIEDMYLHDILGLFMPPTLDWEESDGTSMWDPFPAPAWGNAIEVNADDVTISDVLIERVTGGIGGWLNVGLIENVFVDRASNGGLNVNGNDVTIRYATVLNGQWPNGAGWYGADPFISNFDSGWVVERSEVAYTINGDRVPGVRPGIQDASPVDFDQQTVNSAMRDNFFHDNTGSCFELNLAGGGNRNIVIENNVCYRNGLEDDPRPGGDYARAAFLADACVFHTGQSYTIRGNSIYKAFPGQRLNYYFDTGFADDFTRGKELCGQSVSGNPVYEYGAYPVPLPVPAPPPIGQENIAQAARVEVSSGSGSAALAQDGSLETEWVSAEGKPWIRYVWDRPQTVGRIRLFDRADLVNWAASGVLTFSDGSSVDVTGGILNNGAMREVILGSAKTVTWVQFTVTRNVPESPGTSVGLAELRVYPSVAAEPPPPAPDAGVFTVDFEGRPRASAPLAGRRYPASRNGIYWGHDVWSTAAEGRTGNRSLSLDYRRDPFGQPSTRSPIFVLPHAKVLRGISVACPPKAQVRVFQVGQPRVVTARCDGRLRAYRTRWKLPVSTSVVVLWIDITKAPARVDLNDVRLDDIVYGD